VLNDVFRPDFAEWTAEMSRREGETLVETPSRLANYLAQRIWRKYASNRFIEFVLGQYRSPEHWGELTELMRRAHRAVEAHGAAMLVLIFPNLNAIDHRKYPFRSIHERLQGFLADEGIAFVDLSDAFAAYGPSNLKVHAVDDHPNEIAHGIAAEQVWTAISSMPDWLRGLRGASPPEASEEPTPRGSTP